jgi:hypothetical protein
LPRCNTPPHQPCSHSYEHLPEGKVVKNRLHLDVRAGTGLVGEERLAALEGPNAHDWSRSARYACGSCLPMATTSRAW